MKHILKDLLFFIIGCAVYLMIEIFFRGYSFRLMGIAGGIIFLFGSKLNNWFSWDMDLLLQCFFIAIMITLLEAIIGNLDYYFLHINMWDYSAMPFHSLNAKICLPFSCIWFFFGFPVVLIGDAIDYYVFLEKPIPYYKIFGKKVFQMPVRKCN